MSIFPKLIEYILGYYILKRARDKNLVNINVHNLRDYTTNKHKKVDDYPYGGGSGMVMQIEPFVNFIESFTVYVSYDEILLLSAYGLIFNQNLSNQISLKKNILVLCGHYKVVDEILVQNFITKEVSIGDYVLTGGELPAAVLIDSVVRLLPGVLSDEESALKDSFQCGLLHEPIYTRPANFRGLKVPEILLSGNEKKINEWRLEEAVKRTKLKKR
ncbi:MAG: tRNA (guanosine(37)-N1)-methyltransferase TrmD [Solitalea-like symbiont of Acarus siro]